jgi:hypothetical protein
MHIIFHGASVTAQAGESSYFDCLKRKFGDSIDFTRHGYGACHLNDAGFLTVSEVVAQAPNICFLDWNTTSLAEFDVVKVYFILNSLIAANIKPIFVIFGRSDTLGFDRKSELQIKKICLESLVECWDLRPFIDKKLHLRDAVHTNKDGARVYADFLFDRISSLVSSDRTSITDEKVQSNYSPKVSSELIEMIVFERQTLLINADITGFTPELYALVEVGPESPIISVCNDRKIQLWDQWCHYTRKSFISFYRPLHDVKNILIEIRVLPDTIDYSNCAKPGFNFIGSKELNIQKLFFCDLEINSIEVIPSLN